ncbi:hypothetical protein SPURM210S_04850 [Streptomyces purpurascens]
MMDSGNQGYASPTAKVRPGPFNVTQVTLQRVFRGLKWREKAWFRLRREGRSGTRGADGAGLCLITRVRQRGRPWILRLRFELYVNLAEMEVPEE